MRNEDKICDMSEFEKIEAQNESTFLRTKFFSVISNLNNWSFGWLSNDNLSFKPRLENCAGSFKFKLKFKSERAHF